MDKPKIVVPWLGYDRHHNSSAQILEMELDILVQKDIFLADEALGKVYSAKYPLILVNDVMAPGSLELPPRIRTNMYPQIACYVISEIKRDSLNRETPVVATIFSSGRYVRPEFYKRAGADVVFDFCEVLRGDKHLEAFVSTIRRYLPK